LLLKEHQQDLDHLEILEYQVFQVFHLHHHHHLGLEDLEVLVL
jgi:hypothetical protein